MKLAIKNMVCARCTMMVESIFDRHKTHPIKVSLGEVVLKEDHIPSDKMAHLNKDLKSVGFELIDDKKGRIIEKIKNLIIEQVHHSKEIAKTNLSKFLSSKLQYEYNYLSNLFSEVEGTTIEKYFITQRIEKVKELLVYGELSLSEIADKLDYSSVAYLSSQFKKVTGLTPTFYKSLKENKRRNIEEV